MNVFRMRDLSASQSQHWSVCLLQDAITRPMLRTSNKTVKREAIDVFKQVQIYMGDRMAKSSPTLAALEMVTRGWTNKELRDEIFIQLCRQTTNNPKLSVCLSVCLSLSLSLSLILQVNLG